MPDQQLSLQLPAHQNRQLFSDHYLNEILPAQAGWRGLIAQAGPAMAEIAGILDHFTPSENERQTEDNLVCPVLRALGHTFEVQAALETPDNVKKPDYVFYRDEEALTAHKNVVLTGTVANEGAFAIGDAKYWNRPLDIAVRTKGADALSNKNPSFQIYFYMLHSGVEWGILTNGKRWRLYQRESAHKLDIFYEVDLEELVREGDVERFLYFYAFFRRAAFDPGALSLSEMLRASVEYAHAVGNSLKIQVFDALRHIAQGFLDYPANALQPTPESLKEVYDNSLILLYRLIFILYAEARELLPVRESEMYRDTYSLLAIKTAIARDLRMNKPLLSTSARLWPQLRELFQAINLGNPPLKVATFNGGLFDPQKHPFLEKYTVGDAHLRQAIDMLARVDGQFVDYRDLSVRHMGTIYEGLLEFKLEPICPLTPQPPSPPRGKGENMMLGAAHDISPSCPSGGRRVGEEGGFTIDLTNDKGERKATGSYYTPEYIVKYIVERTVEPVLWEAVKDKQTDAEIVQAVLSVNVLDPAMGSGHFLVEATEYIARFLVDYGILPDGKTAEEADLAYWKRRVAQACVYGVDLNPLAVELAKLSLWLTTVAKDRPLSFLDHHLRPGNSLVGARLTALQRNIGARASSRASTSRASSRAQIQSEQTSLFNDAEFAGKMSVAVNNMWQIERSEAADVKQVKEQENLYADLRRQLVDKYGKLANLLTAQHFGLEVPADLWKPLVSYLMGHDLTTLPKIRELADRAQQTAARERFFHWELEFPELYFDTYGRPLGEEGGFEAVIGNPPYVRQEQLKAYKAYFQEHFSACHGVADLYLYFYEQGLNVAQRDGRLAYISSGTFARANFATTFRQWLPTMAQMESIIDFGENQPFQGAEMVRPSIVVMRKQPMKEGFRSLFIAEKIPASLEMAMLEQGVDCDASALEQSEWTFQHASSTRLFQKIMAAGCSLEEVVGGQMYRGVLTGLNEAFIIDQLTCNQLVGEDPASKEIIKPILRGEDLRPWYQEDEGRWLIAIPCGWTRRTFGEGLSEEDAWRLLSQRHYGISAHLLQFADAARQRWDKGDYWWELRSCDYYYAFENTKIFWPDISKLPRFSYGDEGTYIGNTGYVIPSPDIALLAILQSRVIWFAITQICQPLRLRAGLWQFRILPQFITRLPIPTMNDADRAALGDLAMRITELAKERYALHQRVRHRLASDLGTLNPKVFGTAQGTHKPLVDENAQRTLNPKVKLNQKLTAWWGLDFPALRAEIKKVFKADIPLKERDEWEGWHAAQRAEHDRLTAEIISLETALNARVYALFNLNDDEIALIEESTKYKYGEV